MCMQVLLAHGRLRLDQVVAAVAARLGRPEGEVRGDMHARFVSLINSHYIERVPPADMPLRKPAAHTKTQVRAWITLLMGSRETGAPLFVSDWCSWSYGCLYNLPPAGEERGVSHFSVVGVIQHL